ELGAVLELQLAQRLRGAVEAGEVGEDDDRAVAARRVEGAGHLPGREGEQRAGVPRRRAIERSIAVARDVLALDPDQTDRHTAQVRVPHDRRLRAGPRAPPLEV